MLSFLMASFYEVLLRDSVEEAKAFLATHRFDATELPKYHPFIIEHDCINLFAHYANTIPKESVKAYIYYESENKNSRVKELATEMGIIHSGKGSPARTLSMGTLDEVKALLASSAIYKITTAISHKRFLNNPDTEVVKLCCLSDFVDSREGWDLIASTTIEIADAFYEKHRSIPTKYHVRLAAERKNMPLYRHLRDRFNIRPAASMMCDVIYENGEESDIREINIPAKKVIKYIVILWRREMWELAKEIIAKYNFVPTPKAMSNVANNWHALIHFVQGITYMGWKQYITARVTLQNMNNTAAVYGYWSWFAEDSRKLGIFHCEKHILRPIIDEYDTVLIGKTRHL